MGIAKLAQRRAGNVIGDSDDENAIAFANDSKDQICKQKACQQHIQSVQLRPIIDVEDSTDSDEPLVPKSKGNKQPGPDFLSSPMSTKLPQAAFERPVKVLKLRPGAQATPEGTAAPPSLEVEAEQVDKADNVEKVEKVDKFEQVQKEKQIEQVQKPRKTFLDQLNGSRRKHTALTGPTVRSRASASPKFRHDFASRGSHGADARARASPSKPHRKSAVFHRLQAVPGSVLDCDELADDPPRHLQAPGLSPAKRPEVALVIKKRWCEKIFEGSKIWEIRGCALSKRGRICIAQSKSKMLIGEVEVVDCLKVGRKVDGQLVPWSNSSEHRRDFIGARENLKKHCVEDLNWVPYSKVFAWVLDKKFRYPHPEPYRHKPGCIQWVKLDPSGPEAPQKRGRRSSMEVRSVASPNVTLRPPTSIEPAWTKPLKNVRLLDDDHDDPIEDVD